MSEDHESIGSVGEEAAKLLGAFQDWARENGSGSAAAASNAASALKTLNEHIASGDDCAFCPVCQLIGLVRQTSPEVKDHLSTAASALLQAAAAALSTNVAPRRKPQPQSPVEKIDLVDDAWDED